MAEALRPLISFLRSVADFACGLYNGVKLTDPELEFAVLLSADLHRLYLCHTRVRGCTLRYRRPSTLDTVSSRLA